MSFIGKPQQIWWRKLLFQVHLWTGIGLGLYILVISVTGSAIVFQGEIAAAVQPPIVAAQPGEPLGLHRIQQLAEQKHPGLHVAWFLNKQDPREAVEVWLENDAESKQVLVDPVSGAILGPKGGAVGEVLKFLADLHIHLLAGPTGLLVNGVGAGFLFLMCLTGAIIWWPGIKNWRRSLTIDPKRKWKRLNWDLHSAAGFWTLAFVMIWGVTGVYFAFPGPFRAAIGAVAPMQEPEKPAAKAEVPKGKGMLPVSELIAAAEQKLPGKVNTWIGLPHHEGETNAVVYRQDSFDPSSPLRMVALNAYTGEVVGVRNFDNPPLGDAILQWFGKLHFGNFGGVPVKILWTIFGLAPAFLFVTGSLMWWNRVLSKRWKTRSTRAEDRAASLANPAVPQTD